MDTNASREDISIAVLAEHAIVRAGLRYIVNEATGLNVVSETANIPEAVDIVERRQPPPHVILVDTDSDEITLDAIGRLIEAGPCRVLVLTADPDPRSHQRAVELGAAGVVLKNQPGHILVRAIHKVNSGEIWLDRINTAHVLRSSLRSRGPEDVKIQSITKREREIIQLVGQGLKNAPIGQRLFISEATVRNHLTSILSKLNVADKFELVVYAFHHGLITRKARHPHLLGPVELSSEVGIRTTKTG